MTYIIFLKRSDAFAIDIRDVDGAATAAGSISRVDDRAASHPKSKGVQKAASNGKRSIGERITGSLSCAGGLENGMRGQRELAERFTKAPPAEQKQILRDMSHAGLLAGGALVATLAPPVAPLITTAMAPELAVMTTALAPEIVAGGVALGSTAGLVTKTVRSLPQVAKTARNSVVATTKAIEKASSNQRLADSLLSRANLRLPVASNRSLPIASNRNLPSAVNRNLPVVANDQQLAQTLFMRQRMVAGEGPAITGSLPSGGVRRGASAPVSSSGARPTAPSSSSAPAAPVESWRNPLSASTPGPTIPSRVRTVTTCEAEGKGVVMPLAKNKSVVVRKEDFIGKSSRIIPLDKPGRVMFDGVEFRGVRKLNHLSEEHLWEMYRKGMSPKDMLGRRLDGHHYQQQFHREPGAFMVEIPSVNHCISNPIQHPLGTSGGLTKAQKADWKNLRRAFNKERARAELTARGLL